jgi:hypothetical protein
MRGGREGAFLDTCPSLGSWWRRGLSSDLERERSNGGAYLEIDKARALPNEM